MCILCLNQGFTQRDFDLVDHQTENDPHKPLNLGGEATQGTDKSRIECHQNSANGFRTSDEVDRGISLTNGTSVEHIESTSPELVGRGSKRPIETTEPNLENKRIRTVILDSDDESPAKESAVNTDKGEDKSDSKENAGELYGDTKNPDNKFNCTACSKIAVKVHSHPLLKVIVCADCKSSMAEKMKAKVSAYSYHAIKKD